MDIQGFIVEFITKYANELYTGFSCLFVVLLYGYIYHLYSSQATGKRDYEKYADLALKDNLSDVLIESRETKK